MVIMQCSNAKLKHAYIFSISCYCFVFAVIKVKTYLWSSQGQ